MKTLDPNVSFISQSELTDYLQQCIKEASQIMTPYWPISTFIASNGLGGLENLPFEQALAYSQQLRGSQGYLPLASYYDFFANGRITEADLEAIIANRLDDLHLPETLTLGAKTLLTRRFYQDWMMAERRPKPDQERGELWDAIFLELKELNFFAEKETVPIQTLGDSSITRSGEVVTEIINKRMIIWCAAFLDDGQAAWPMPGREQGFYKCWKSLVEMERAFRHYTTQDIPEMLRTLPDEPMEALRSLLQGLGINQADWSAYLSRHPAQLPGWASLVLWREQHPEVSVQQQYPITLSQYLAVRLFYEAALVAPGNATAKIRQLETSSSLSGSSVAPGAANQTETIERLVRWLSSLQLTSTEIRAIPTETFQGLALLARNSRLENQQAIWQEAYERHYRQHLMQELQAGRRQSELAAKAKNPAVQSIFCIDVRSEGLRRKLEKLGAYETYGFAGFFGIPMLYQPYGSSCNLTLAPALITPTQLIKELPKAAPEKAIQQRIRFNKWRYNSYKLNHSLRENLLTSFAFVEMVGWLSFFPLVGKTLMPGAWRKLQLAIQAKLRPSIPTEPSIIANPDEMSFQAQMEAVANMLRSIGLTNQFARLVLICGHGSETENNPYASALDCGACGGNRGGNSAYIAASVLNSKPVRGLLAEQGLLIPEETFFLAGEHNTTTDEVSFLNKAQLPQTHLAEFEQFKQALSKASQQNARERWQKLPGVTSARTGITEQMQQRAADWAQVRPEWGLIRNAAFICGSRTLTSELNLDNRVFLHSYQQQQDVDGTILEGILTAPVVVAEWINMQYYLSTVDNQKFGSGTKLLHTVVGQVGVMQGRLSDILVGLPQQSVMVGEQLYHEPLRLCVIIEAPTERIEKIVAKHSQLQHLIGNKWIELVAYDVQANTFQRFSAGKEWHKVS